MSIAVMNLQRQIVASSHFDVRTEGLLLGLATGISGAEVIQAALPHGNHQRVSQAFLYHGQGLVKGNMVLTHLRKQTIGGRIGAAGVQGGLVRVDREGNANSLMCPGKLEHRIKIWQLAGAGNHPCHAYLACALQLFLKGHLDPVRAGDFSFVDGKMCVIVNDRQRQGIGRIRPGTRLTLTHCASSVLPHDGLAHALCGLVTQKLADQLKTEF